MFFQVGTEMTSAERESPDALANLCAGRLEDSELCVTGQEHLATVPGKPLTSDVSAGTLNGDALPMDAVGTATALTR